MEEVPLVDLTLEFGRDAKKEIKAGTKGSSGFKNGSLRTQSVPLFSEVYLLSRISSYIDHEVTKLAFSLL